MRRFEHRSTLRGLALALAVSAPIAIAGCATGPDYYTSKDPDVEHVIPTAGAIEMPSTTTATVVAPGTTVVQTPPNTVVQAPAGSVVQAPANTVVRTPGGTVVQAPPNTVVQTPSGATVTTSPDPALVPAPPAGTVIATPGTTTVVPSTNGATTVIPQGSTVAVPPAGIPAMLRADEIESPTVRAHTIYANRIDADQIRGIIHQDRDLKIGDTRGDIRAPEVVASVIYADEIKANQVIAEHIYVKNIRRR